MESLKGVTDTEMFAPCIELIYIKRELNKIYSMFPSKRF